MCDWSKCVVWLNIPQPKLGNIQVIFPNFQNCMCRKKYLKDNKHKSLHLIWKYAPIGVLGHHLFLKAHSFPWATHSRKTVRFFKQIMSVDRYPMIFPSQMETIVYLISVASSIYMREYCFGHFYFNPIFWGCF